MTGSPAKGTGRDNGGERQMANAMVVKHAEDVLRVVHGPGAGGAPSAIDMSWGRCVNQFKLDPSRLYTPTVVDQARLKERQAQHEELVEIARAEMDSLYEQIAGSGHALLLTDASGVILCEKIDPALKQMFRSAGLTMGADWSEQHEGTNGIGTCIAEQRSVTVYRDDHFRVRHIGLSCSGAPIRDCSGQVVAVLDASSVDARAPRASQMHTMALVNISAQLIEKCLFLRRFRHHAVLRFHHRPELVNLLHDGALALAEDGTVIAADVTAGKLLGVEDRRELCGRPIAEILDGGLRELGALDHALRNAIWQIRDVRHGRRYYASLMRGGHHGESAPPVMPARDSRVVVEVPAAPPSGRGMSLEELAGEDPQMLRNIRSAHRVARSQVSILIRGPTGSGKEAFAKALHLASDRAERPFVAVNCAAIPESLIESELFGYKSGAFTGARREGMRGKVLQADGGTLFLDEIGDMPLLLQTRLLRVLEEREVVPLGSETPVSADLRVISASHRNLVEMIERGSFREDLYYRLNGITLELPSLAQREDKERLIRQIIAGETRDGRPVAVEIDAFQQLLRYRWPGNIRELRNVIRTALAICEGGVVCLHDLPREIREWSPQRSAAAPAMAAPALPEALPAAAPDAPGGTPLAAAERAALLATIEKNRWNMSATAQQLGISRNTLYRKIKRHGIPLSDFRCNSL
jgi:transcriptional regulator of acetoin/glycerol metabolism